jgi:hypothetical protein
MPLFRLVSGKDGGLYEYLDLASRGLVPSSLLT